jgi:hypothetical protein
MKTDAPAIAKREMFLIRKSGERVPLIVEIGAPRQHTGGFWHTPVALHGVDGRLSDICGEDSLQSLCLAVELVRRRISSLVGSGQRVVDEDGGDFPFEAYFLK